MADLVIRNATIVDGTGAPAVHGDVAVTADTITAVGPRLDERGHREIDADGLMVTPGFVDIHTHYDGQVTWDGVIAPSSLHGVTSIVMGNCGVGFAPARPTAEHHDWLIGLLEGVEDIPGTALAEGLPWDWESFTDYLDSLGRRRYAVDIGAQVAHAPLRAYVMGERGADPNESPTADELAEMARLTRQGIDAGALGFTTSRTILHRTRDGEPLGTRYSSTDELTAIASALSDAGKGVLQMISDAYLSPDADFANDELALMRTLVETTGRPLSMTVQQPDDVPDRWREMIDFVGGCVADGLPMRAQVAPRPIGVLQGLASSLNPFVVTAGYREIGGPAAAGAGAPAARPRAQGPHPARARGPHGGHARRAHAELPQALPAQRPGRLRAGGGRLDPGHRPRHRSPARPRWPTTSCSRTTATSCSTCRS